MNAKLIIDGQIEGCLVFDAVTVKAGYGSAIIEAAEEGSIFGQMAFPVSDFDMEAGVSIGPDTRYKVLVLVNPNVTIEGI